MKLNLGCGTDIKKGWINCDIVKTHPSVRVVDLNQKLPFKTESVDFIMMDNVLEHVENHLGLLKEIWRILKFKGKIQIIVPHVSNKVALSDIWHYRCYSAFSFDRLKKGHKRNYFFKTPFEIQELWLVHWFKPFELILNFNLIFTEYFLTSFLQVKEVEVILKKIK